MEDKKLIECVREQRFLYDFSHPLYSDVQRKSREWQQIAQTLKQDPSRCKIRWESLRNQFRKYVRSTKTVTGQASGSPSKWKHYENMSFLTPFMKEKTRYTSVAAENEGHAVSPEGENIGIDDDHLSENSTPTPHCPTAIQMLKSYTPNRKGRQAVETASGVLMKHLLEEEKKTENKEQQDKDDIDLFFDTMKATVKKFTVQNKMLAKQRVFNVINELEGINFNQLQPPQSAHSCPVPDYHHCSAPTHSQNASSPFSPASSHQTASSLETFSPEN